VPVQKVVGQSEFAIIVLVEIRAFKDGCLLELDIAAKAAGDVSDPDSRMEWQRRKGMAGVGAPVDPVDREDAALQGLFVGVEFADGRSARSGEYVLIPAAEPEAPSLISIGGAGFRIDADIVRMRDTLWLWPLPPAEPFGLVAEWPGFDIPFSRIDIDGSTVVAAAETAVPYW
jgi:hypothetical protein